MKSYTLFTLNILLTILIVFSNDRIRKRLFVQDPIEYSRDPVAHLREIVRNRDSEALFNHIDPEVHHFDYVRSRNDLDSVWHISELQENSEIWGYLETRILAEKIRPACLDSVHYSYVNITPLLIPCDNFRYLNDTVYEDYFTVKNCDVFSDQDLKQKIGTIEGGESILTNWEKFDLVMDARQDVLPIRERKEHGITGWVLENDVFNFIDGPYLLINWKNGHWVISGM